MNKVELVGRLTRDPEVRYTQTNNTLVATFSLAIRRRFVREGDNQTADFINCVAWSKTGEFVSKYFKKGQMMEVVGRIQTRSYDDANGQKRYVTEVVADNVEFLGSKASSENSNNTKGSSKKNDAEPTPYDFGDMPEPKGTDVDSNPFADFGSSIEISDDELPF